MDNGKYDIYFSTSQNGGNSWSSPYTLDENISTSQDPLPVIQANVTSQDDIVVCFYNGDELISYTTDNDDPDDNDWNTKVVPGTDDDSIRPSVAGATHYWDGSTVTGLAYEKNDKVYYNYFHPNSGSSGSWSSSTEELSDVVPGSADHETPSLGGVSGSSHLYVAWHRITGSGSSNYDHTLIYRKSSGFDTWPSQYTQVYYERQQLPSISALSSNDVNIVFQEPFDEKVYKTNYNGSTWSVPSLISNNVQYPSLSSGSSEAKYVYTKGTSSPYEIKLSSETFSKSTAETDEYYSRAINWIDPFGAYLQVRVHPFSIKLADGNTEPLSFIDASFDESNQLTTENTWDWLATIPNRLPANAESLIVSVTVEAEGLENVIEQSGDRKLALNILGPLDETLGSVEGSQLLGSGDMPQTRYRFSFPLKSIDKTINIRANIKINDIHSKPTTFASLGHIFDFNQDSDTKKSAANSEVAFETAKPQGFIIESNFPNPFNPSTTIRYHISQTTHVKIVVYNSLGIQVRSLINRPVSAGIHEIVWDGKDDRQQPAGSGVYFLRMTAATGSRQFVDTKKMC
mgnify:CR=1 FL=1